MRVKVIRLIEYTYYVEAKDVDEAVQWVVDGNVVPVSQSLLDMKAFREVQWVVDGNVVPISQSLLDMKAFREELNNETKHI